MKRTLAVLLTTILFLCTLVAALPVHAAETTYNKITSSSELVDGGKYVIVHFYSPNSTYYIMSHTFATKSNGSSSRSGMDAVEANGMGGASITGDYAQYEWTFVKSGDKWLLQSGDKYLTIADDPDNAGKLITKLDATGDAFTVSDGFKFGNADNEYLNYNSRGVVNAAAGDNSTDLVLYAKAAPVELPGEEGNYRLVKNAADLKDNGTYIFVHQASNYPNNIMIPEVTTVNQRTGMKVHAIASAGEDTITGKYSSFHWTLVKSGANWQIKAGDKLVKIAEDASIAGKYTATLESSGTTFKVSALGEKQLVFLDVNSTDAAMYGFNYNQSRDLINGILYTDPVALEGFYVYELVVENNDNNNQQQGGATPRPNPVTGDASVALLITAIISFGAIVTLRKKNK